MRLNYRRQLAGVQIVPSSLVWAVRGILNSRGIDPAQINDSGEIDLQALVALGITRIEIRSKLSEPIVIDLTKKSGGEVPKLLQEVKPQVILTGPAGRYEIAPAGPPDGIDPRLRVLGVNLGWGLGLGLLGVALIGYAIAD